MSAEFEEHVAVKSTSKFSRIVQICCTASPGFTMPNMIPKGARMSPMIPGDSREVTYLFKKFELVMLPCSPFKPIEKLLLGKTPG
jgi:hypothetical protein